MSNFYSHLIYFHDNFIVLIMKIKLKLHLPLKAHEKTVNLSRVKKAVGVLSNSIMSQSLSFSVSQKVQCSPSRVHGFLPKEEVCQTSW